MAVLQERGREEAFEPSSSKRRSSYLFYGLIAIFVVGAVLALVTANAGGSAAKSTAVDLVTAEGSTAPRVGQPAPNFTLQTIDDKTISLADLRGRPVLINFWATWCPPCRGEMPDLEAISREYRDAGLVVLGVNLQEEREPVARYAGTANITFPLLLDRDGIVAGQYALTNLPTSYFVDRAGIIRDANLGALTLRGLRTRVAKVL